jgi:hypothetical protein
MCCSNQRYGTISRELSLLDGLDELFGAAIRKEEEKEG